MSARQNILLRRQVAEGEGFEPPEGVNPQRFSRPPQSTALPPLHEVPAKAEVS